MKKHILGLAMTANLLVPTVTFASEESMSTKNENTDVVVRAKLTQDGGRNEHDTNDKLGSTKNVSINGTTDLEKSWGYTHEPTKLTTNSKVALNDEGKQSLEIKFDKSTSDHNQVNSNIAFLGVKNKSRQISGWRLSAKTNFVDTLGEKAKGATFSSNKSLVQDLYNKERRKLDDNELTTTQGCGNSLFTNYSQGGKVVVNNELTEIFSGKEGIVHNGLYTLQLLNCTIELPDTRRIQNDDFKCNITWNLAKAPAAAEVTE